MSWITLAGLNTSAAGHEFGFMVRSRGDERMSLDFMISAELMGTAGWSAETRLLLQVDRKKKLGQLLAVETQGRKMRVTSLSGRGAVSFAYTCELEKFFSQYAEVCDLESAEVEGDAITFKLPAVAVEDEEGTEA